MENCWKSKPEDRPSFTEIYEELIAFLNDNEVNIFKTKQKRIQNR